jgi:hypothetical protein
MSFVSLFEEEKDEFENASVLFFKFDQGKCVSLNLRFYRIIEKLQVEARGGVALLGSELEEALGPSKEEADTRACTWPSRGSSTWTGTCPSSRRSEAGTESK